jgi:large conductance mechanosensitive channel
MSSLLKEFKEFALRGNVVDLAVGVIIGGAFGKIVSSLVADVLMPPIGVLLGGVDFSSLAITLKDGPPPVVIRYGAFINSVIDFLIVAAVIFGVVKAMNTLKRSQAAAPAAPSATETLLTEIRDLLRKGR